jgi:hypothetical protein
LILKKEKPLVKNADAEDIEERNPTQVTNVTTKSAADTSHQSKQRGNAEGKESNMSDRCGKLKARIKSARTKQKRGKALHSYMMCRRGH